MKKMSSLTTVLPVNEEVQVMHMTDEARTEFLNALRKDTRHVLGKVVENLGQKAASRYKEEEALRSCTKSSGKVVNNSGERTKSGQWMTSGNKKEKAPLSCTKSSGKVVENSGERTKSGPWTKSGHRKEKAPLSCTKSNGKVVNNSGQWTTSGHKKGKAYLNSSKSSGKENRAPNPSAVQLGNHQKKASQKTESPRQKLPPSPSDQDSGNSSPRSDLGSLEEDSPSVEEKSAAQPVDSASSTDTEVAAQGSHSPRRQAFRTLKLKARDHAPKTICFEATDPDAFGKDMAGDGDAGRLFHTPLDRPEPQTSEQPGSAANSPVVAPHQEHATPELTTECPDVTHKDKLDKLATDYATIIKSHEVPNVMEELYLVIQMLTAQSPSPDMKMDPGDDALGAELGKVPNTVYFAVQVIKKISHLYRHLDPSTLRLLAENARLQQFGVSSVFERMYRDAMQELEKSGRQSFSTITVDLTLFQENLHRRQYFETQMSFDKFRSQRDELADMLTVWSRNHHKASWSMRETLGKRICKLLYPEQDGFMYLRFAVHFVNVLIKETVVKSLPAAVRRLRPTKCQRLQLRLLAFLSRGPSPPPTFTDQERFFKNFIKIADSYPFNRHLCCVLVTKIDELRESNYMKENGTEDADVLCKTVETLQVLGKFLGLVVFQPFETVHIQSPAMLDISRRARMSTQLPADLKARLCEAVKEGWLLLTLPWLTELISMADVLAFKLPILQDALTILKHLLRYAWSRVLAEDYTRLELMMVLKIDWLFRTSRFPPELVIQTPPPMHLDFTPPPDSLDVMAEFDTVTLYEMCSFLHELTLLLASFGDGKEKSSTLRRITQSALALPTAPLSEEAREDAMVHDLESCMNDEYILTDRIMVDFVINQLTRLFEDMLNKYLPDLLANAKEELAMEGKKLHEECCSQEVAKGKLHEKAMALTGVLVRHFTVRASGRFHGPWWKRVINALTSLAHKQNEAFFGKMLKAACQGIEDNLRCWLQQFEEHLQNLLIHAANVICTQMGKEVQEGDEVKQEEPPFIIPFCRKALHQPALPVPGTRAADQTGAGKAKVEDAWVCTCDKLYRQELAEASSNQSKDHHASGNGDRQPDSWSLWLKSVLKTKPKREMKISNMSEDQCLDLLQSESYKPKDPTTTESDPLHEVGFLALDVAAKATTAPWRLSYGDLFIWPKATRALRAVEGNTHKTVRDAAWTVYYTLKQLVIRALVHQPEVFQAQKEAIDEFHRSTIKPDAAEFISCSFWNLFQGLKGNPDKLAASMAQYSCLLSGLAKTESEKSIDSAIDLTIEIYQQYKIQPEDIRGYAVVGALAGLFQAKDAISSAVDKDDRLKHLGHFFFSSPLMFPLRQYCGLKKSTFSAMKNIYMSYVNKQVAREEREEMESRAVHLEVNKMDYPTLTDSSACQYESGSQCTAFPALHTDDQEQGETTPSPCPATQCASPQEGFGVGQAEAAAPASAALVPELPLPGQSTALVPELPFSGQSAGGSRKKRRRQRLARERRQADQQTQPG